MILVILGVQQLLNRESLTVLSTKIAIFHNYNLILIFQPCRSLYRHSDEPRDSTMARRREIVGLPRLTTA